MNVIIKKRQIIMSALVLALGSAVFVNWYFTKPEAAATGKEESVSYSVLGDAQYVSSTGKVTTSYPAADPLDEYALNREKAHGEAFDMLNAVINDSSAAKSAVDTAAKHLAELTNTIKLESDIESLIKAKCNFRCIVTINSDKAEVVCEKGKLDSTTSLQIKEIILKYTNINSENITIFDIK